MFLPFHPYPEVEPSQPQMVNPALWLTVGSPGKVTGLLYYFLTCKLGDGNSHITWWLRGPDELMQGKSLVKWRTPQG